MTTLNPMQLHLLQLFSLPMSDAEIEEIKDLLVEHFDKKAQIEMDRLWDEKKLDQAQINEMANTHFRTPYEKK